MLSCIIHLHKYDLIKFHIQYYSYCWVHHLCLVLAINAADILAYFHLNRYQLV